MIRSVVATFMFLAVVASAELSPEANAIGDIIASLHSDKPHSARAISKMELRESGLLAGFDSFMANDYPQIAAKVTASRRLASAEVDANPCATCQSSSAAAGSAVTVINLPTGEESRLAGVLQLGYGESLGSYGWSTTISVPASATPFSQAFLALRQVGHVGVNLALNDFALNAPRLVISLGGTTVGPFNLGDITKQSVAGSRDPWEWYIALDPALVSSFAGQTVSLSMSLPGLTCPTCSCDNPQDICLLSMSMETEEILDLCGVANVVDPDGSDNYEAEGGLKCADTCLGMRVNGVGVNKFFRDGGELEDAKCAALSLRIRDNLCIDLTDSTPNGNKCMPVCRVPRTWAFGNMEWPYCTSGECKPIAKLTMEEMYEFYDYVELLMYGLQQEFGYGDAPSRRLRGEAAEFSSERTQQAVSNIPAPIWAEAKAHAEARKLLSEGHCQRGAQIMSFAVNPTLLVE